jgi:hypothetical protein
VPEALGKRCYTMTRPEVIELNRLLAKLHKSLAGDRSKLKPAERDRLEYLETVRAMRPDKVKGR